MDEGRLSNVAVAIVVPDGAEAGSPAGQAALRVARLAGDLFDEVVLIGPGIPPDAPGRRVAHPGAADPLALLVTALEAVQAERVWVLDPHRAAPAADLLLAGVAWPEAHAVAAGATEFEPFFALYRREPVRRRARALLGRGAEGLAALLGEIETGRLESADLERLAAQPEPAPCGPE